MFNWQWMWLFGRWLGRGGSLQCASSGLQFTYCTEGAGSEPTIQASGCGLEA